MVLSAVTEYETASLSIAEAGLSIAEAGLYIAGATAFASAVSAVAAAVAAVGIRRFGIAMDRSNKRRAEADQHRADVERDRHEESMTALKELIRRTAPPQAGPAEWRDAAAPVKPAGTGSFRPPQRIGAQGKFGPACSPNAVDLVGAGPSGRSSAWRDCRPAQPRPPLSPASVPGCRGIVAAAPPIARLLRPRRRPPRLGFGPPAHHGVPPVRGRTTGPPRIAGGPHNPAPTGAEILLPGFGCRA